VKKTSRALLGATILALIFAVAVPTYAQDEEKPARPEDKPAQEDKRPPQKPEDDKDAKHDDKQVQEDKRVQDEKRAQDDKQVREDKDKNVQRDDRDVHHAGGRIPDDRFRANFGRAHVFVINRPVIVEGAPRFQYGGYWFVIAAPWPAGWAYTDQVYVDFIDGEYFLLSPVHPGVQVSINVVM
jgi:hypothetical protein